MRFMLELQKLLTKKFQQKGTSSIRESSVLHNLAVLCMEIMVEDWMCLQLGMHLQIGVLRFF